MPLSDRHKLLRILIRISPIKIGRKINKESTDPGRLYRVRELAEICGVDYRTALRWIQLR